MNIYSIKDTKLGSMGRLMESPNLPVIIRDLKEVVNQDGTTLNKNPEDYQLFQVGEWDEKSGEITPMSPKFMINIIDIMNIVNSDKTKKKAGQK